MSLDALWLEPADQVQWRYLAILAIATFEIRTALRADHPGFLTKGLNPLFSSVNLGQGYLPFQAAIFARKIALSVMHFYGPFIAVLLRIPRQPGLISDSSDDSKHDQLDRLDMVLRDTQLNTLRLLDLEASPFRDSELAKKELKEAVRNFLVQNVVHQDPEVRNAIGESIARRRTGAPAGAKGTR